MQTFVLCLLVAVAAVAAAPQREGAAFTKEAIKQAQNTFLIPKDAEIQKVSYRSLKNCLSSVLVSSVHIKYFDTHPYTTL